MTLLYPSSPYFVNANFLLEFTNSGLVIPTRCDITPYMLSPFSTFFHYPTQAIDAIKFVLLIYTFYIVLNALYNKKASLSFLTILIMYFSECAIIFF